MVEMFFRYRVHPTQVRAFEHAYGPTGPWAKLFARDPHFRRTRLFRHKTDPAIYVSVDVWESKAAWDEFRQTYAQEYNELDRQLALLKFEEHFLGYYEGDYEYHAPIDTQA